MTLQMSLDLGELADPQAFQVGAFIQLLGVGGWWPSKDHERLEITEYTPHKHKPGGYYTATCWYGAGRVHLASTFDPSSIRIDSR